MPKHNTLALMSESVQTTDATVTDVSTFTTVPSKVFYVIAEIAAINAGDLTTGAAYVRSAAFRTSAAGVLTIIGAVATTVTIEDTAGWDATIDASGTDIRVRVTGAAATTVNWRAQVRILQVGIGPERT